MRYTIAVDFDGVIHSYTSPWTTAAEISDPPVEGAIDWLNAIAADYNVVIFTTRAETDTGRVAVLDWLMDQGMDDPPEVTDRKPMALVYVDDRGYRFDGSNFPTVEEIAGLVPWNKAGR